jgi:integrase/recombinase XerD
MKQAKTLSQQEVRRVLDYVATLTVRSPQQPLFGTQKNRERGFTPNTAAQHFLTMYRGAGIDGASSHSGRRTFITSLANKGVGVRVLMSLAGHQSMSTTQSYIDVNAELMRKAVELA